MGGLAGWLLGLNGKLGLAGWHGCFCWRVAGTGVQRGDFQAVAGWSGNSGVVNKEEKAWLQIELKTESAQAHLGPKAGALQALGSAKVWMTGGYLFCTLFIWPRLCILRTGDLSCDGMECDAGGILVAVIGLVAAAAMLLASRHPIRTEERPLHCIVPCLIMAVGFAVAGTARNHGCWWWRWRSASGRIITAGAIVRCADAVFSGKGGGDGDCGG